MTPNNYWFSVVDSVFISLTSNSLAFCKSGMTFLEDLLKLNQPSVQSLVDSGIARMWKSQLDHIESSLNSVKYTIEVGVIHTVSFQQRWRHYSMNMNLNLRTESYLVFSGRYLLIVRRLAANQSIIYHMCITELWGYGIEWCKQDWMHTTPEMMTLSPVGAYPIFLSRLLLWVNNYHMLFCGQYPPPLPRRCQ